MRNHKYSLILTGITIIILSLILVILIVELNYPTHNIKSWIISNQEVSQKEEYNSEKITLNLSWNLIEKETVNNQKLEEKIILDTINSVWETWEKESCDNIKSEIDKNKCIDNSYSAKANIDNNPDICNKINNNEQNINCVDNYYNLNALKLLDFTLCNKITNSTLKNSCNYSIVITKIESPDFKEWIEICNILNWENKTFCQDKIKNNDDWEILKKAIDTLDLKSCNTIKTDNLKNKCLDVINFKLAISNKNNSLCWKINDEKLKSQCYDTLIKIKK